MIGHHQREASQLDGARPANCWLAKGLSSPEEAHPKSVFLPVICTSKGSRRRPNTLRYTRCSAYLSAALQSFPRPPSRALASLTARRIHAHVSGCLSTGKIAGIPSLGHHSAHACQLSRRTDSRRRPSPLRSLLRLSPLLLLCLADPCWLRSAPHSACEFSPTPRGS